MSKKDKTPEELIREAAAAGKIEFAESYTIEEYDDIAREFLGAVFDIDFDGCFISDKSTLSDFSSCCVPEDYGVDKSLPEKERYKKMYAAGRANMVKIIKEKYGIDVDPYEYLISVFEKIRQKNKIVLN